MKKGRSNLPIAAKGRNLSIKENADKFHQVSKIHYFKLFKTKRHLTCVSQNIGFVDSTKS